MAFLIFMSWRPAKSLVALRNQINAAFPNRDKASDGTIGDARHQASVSDHNPNKAGVVCAIDIDKDLSPTVKIDGVVQAITKARDPRIHYIIWRGQIMSSVKSPWVWRKYTGTNGHFEHLHISVKQDPKFYDDSSPWDLGLATAVPAAADQAPANEPQAQTLLREGMKGSDVKHLQNRLISLGFLKTGQADADFGPKTKAAVIAFQKSRGLTADGVVGPKTWRAIG